MTRLSDCVSIVQLGFGLNAVVPALLLSLQRIRASLENALVVALQNQRFKPALNETEATQFAQFIVAGWSFAGLTMSTEMISLGRV
jgi:hypothetical protein